MPYKNAKPVSASLDIEGINMLIFGDPGSGKTPLLGTANSILILDADTGTKSAGLWGKGDKVEFVPMRCWSDYEDVYEWLRHEGHAEYDWLALDSATLFAEWGLSDIMDEVVARNPRQNRYVPDRGQYQENMNRLLETIRNIKALPMNVVVTAHSFEWEDDDGKVQRGPLIRGKDMPKKVSGYMDIIGYLGREGKQPCLFVGPSSSMPTRDRFVALGGKLVDPTIPKIEQLVKAKAGGAKRATSPRSKTATARKAVAKKAAVRRSN